MRKRTPLGRSGKTVLLVDDNQEYLASAARLVALDGHKVVTAGDPREGLEILRRQTVDLVLVDYFMPAMTGEDFVVALRRFNPWVQVILQTGYASERPAREMLRRLDIQGYHEKSDGPEKLRLWVDIGLKAASTLQLLERSRAGLAYVLGVTRELHKIQPLEQLLQVILTQLTGLLGAIDSFAALSDRSDPKVESPDVLIAMIEQGEPRICSGTGRFRTREAGASSRPSVDDLRRYMNARRVQEAFGGTIVPLRVGEAAVGVIFLDRPVVDERDADLIALFANQASVAIQNVSLYELAAIDPLTRVYTRRFLQEALIRELRSAYGNKTGLALLFVDVDDMKSLNDQGGHLCGDEALSGVGALLRDNTRGADVVGRFGGDEFVVVLSDAIVADIEAVRDRLRESGRTLEATGANGERRRVGLTMGAVYLAPPESNERVQRHSFYDAMATRLLAHADDGLYAGKRARKCLEPVTADVDRVAIATWHVDPPPALAA